MISLLLADFYKLSHPFQYPKGTQLVYSNLTARKSRIQDIQQVVFFGLQYFVMEYLEKHFKENFFNLPLQDVLDEYTRVCNKCIGGLPSYQHIIDLHQLGYLPIAIKALPEGSLVNIGVPMLTIYNTNNKFFWVTNALESIISAIIWQPITSATIALQYKKIFMNKIQYSIKDTSFVDFMGHDFSFRGMGGLESSILSGMGHLTSFKGTDTIPAVLAMEKYYQGGDDIGFSVPATEHSVMSSGTAIYGEFETFRQLIEDIYPSGIVSIVSDTFDLWKVLTHFMPRLKDSINKRNGKVVIRPDSGDPYKIICGDKFSSNENERKGVIELLWDTFGGTTINGYKVLSDKVGAIYGDSITIDRANDISDGLMAKGFAPLLVYGIGSYTYQYNTRDTFGMAIKCTAIVYDNNTVEVYKDPVTDDGTKKSARGLLRVSNNILYDRQTWDEEGGGDLGFVYYNGQIIKKYTLQEIRNRINNYIL
jgi:nicotinamide phosphoribosyltransferase